MAKALSWGLGSRSALSSLSLAVPILAPVSNSKCGEHFVTAMPEKAMRNFLKNLYWNNVFIVKNLLRRKRNYHRFAGTLGG